MIPYGKTSDIDKTFLHAYAAISDANEKDMSRKNR